MSDSEYSESYWSSDYEDSEAFVPLFEWDEDYCLEALFSPPSEDDGTTITNQRSSTRATKPSSNDPGIELSMLTNPQLDVADELTAYGSTPRKLDAEQDCSDPKDENPPRKLLKKENNFKPVVHEKSISRSHEGIINVEVESKPDSGKEIEDLQLFMDFLSL